ncbi:hypothetical protein D4740_08045 [Actinomyces sp. 2119]|uniref:hypothetical protein n=1 Tax=Actinomyces sp. 2119 TaxID=2321393 RepID=UPI000E6CDC66|nr:hypothetical protein [Actinomyces sp. 2119]RJF41992.1 hypothetical protein D4740_08045 [Actinomyces sp. 2119]
MTQAGADGPGENMQVYVRRELTLDDVVAAVPAGYAVEGVDGDGAYITVRREGTKEVLAVLEENSLDMDFRFYDYLVEVSGKDAMHFVYDVHEVSSGRQPRDRRSACDRRLELAVRLAQAGDGVVADALTRQLWPEPGPHVPDYDLDAEDEEPGPRVRVVCMTWYVRHRVCSQPVHAWVRALSAVAPQWLPTRYTGVARMWPFDVGRLEEVEERWRSDEDGVNMDSPSPIDLALFRHLDPREPHGMYRVECVVPAEAFIPADTPAGSPAEVPLLHELFTTVADELQAELALAEVLDGWERSDRGDVMPVESPPEEESEWAQSLKDGAALVAGLPEKPVWWTWLGPAYERLVYSALPGLRGAWDQHRSRHGLTLVPAGLDLVPTKADALPATWFPQEFCFWTRRRRFGRPRRRPADRLPQWD